MDTWISLSIFIDEATLPFPGDEGLKIQSIKTWDKDGYHLSHVSLNMHLGTHIDHPSHVLNQQHPREINHFVGRANVIFVEPKNGLIKTQDIIDQYLFLEEKERSLIISLNHERLLNTNDYFIYPKFEKSLMSFLVEQKITLLGSDLPSYEYMVGDMLDMHRDILNHQMTLVESMVNLTLLKSNIDLVILPIPIKGVEANIVSAIAKNH